MVGPTLASVQVETRQLVTKWHTLSDGEHDTDGTVYDAKQDSNTLHCDSSERVVEEEDTMVDDMLDVASWEVLDDDGMAWRIVLSVLYS